MSFVHLHGHSTFSFLEAIGKPAAIINKAKELGMNAIAITDYHGMYGSIKFYQGTKDTGIKPIIGIETGFVMDIDSQIPEQQIGNIVLLAKNKEGYLFPETYLVCGCPALLNQNPRCSVLNPI